MRKIFMSSAFMVLALLLACGVAVAVTKNCRAGADFCVGTNGPDTLNGSAERDKIYGQPGNDTLRGNGGPDLLSGGDDNDVLAGGADNDSFNGGRGDDTQNGGPGVDDLSATSQGNDLLLGDSNPSGTTEFLVDFEGRNFLSGGGGNDNLFGHDRLNGGPGNDEIRGSYVGRSDAIRTMTGGPGADRIDSNGVVNDTIYVRDGERDAVDCGRGTDTVYFDRGIDSVNPANCERRFPRWGEPTSDTSRAEAIAPRPSMLWWSS